MKRMDVCLLLAVCAQTVSAHAVFSFEGNSKGLSPVVLCWQTQKIAGNWQTPGEIQQPKGTWQTPGQIQQPKGPVQTPGEITRPKAIQTPKEIQIPKNWLTVKDSGCEHRLTVGSDVLFEFNKWDLNPNAEQGLKYLGEEISKSGKHPIEVEGHTDGIGADDYNQTLSEKRAASVKEWLIVHSFIDDSAQAVGFGKKKPVAPNKLPNGKDNPAGRKKNRRVEIVIDTCK
jgi:outer membrane protein OmpA-like peptidoglycan-associated protein